MKSLPSNSSNCPVNATVLPLAMTTCGAVIILEVKRNGGSAEAEIDFVVAAAADQAGGPLRPDLILIAASGGTADHGHVADFPPACRQKIAAEPADERVDAASPAASSSRETRWHRWSCCRCAPVS